MNKKFLYPLIRTIFINIFQLISVFHKYWLSFRSVSFKYDHLDALKVVASEYQNTINGTLSMATLFSFPDEGWNHLKSKLKHPFSLFKYPISLFMTLKAPVIDVWNLPQL